LEAWKFSFIFPVNTEINFGGKDRYEFRIGSWLGVGVGVGKITYFVVA
jgi:hypothetical protein